MKYIVSLLACLPALGVGVSTIWFFVMAFDYKWAIILCIFDLFGFVYLLDNIENIANNIVKFWDKIIKDMKQE